MTAPDAALVRRLEALFASTGADCADGMAAQLPDAGARWKHLGPGTVTFTGRGFFASRVTGLGVDGPVDPALLDEGESFLRSCGAPVEVSIPTTADPSFVALLADRGYVVRWLRNLYARPLTPEDATIARSEVPAAVRVRAVAEPAGEEGDVWNETIVAGFGGDAAATERQRVWNRMVLRRPGVTTMVATVDGVPAGGAAVVVRDRIADLFSMTTRTEARNRGVQGALIRARVALAAEHGCEVAVVSADAGSVSARNLERHGFALAYVHLGLVRPA